MPISKKAPFSALETLDDDFFSSLRMFERKLLRSFTLIAYANEDHFFFAALIVDPFVFFPRKRSAFIRRGKEVNGTRRRPVGIFFFSLSREDFFSHFTFNGCKGDFFLFCIFTLWRKKSLAWMSLKSTFLSYELLVML